VIGIETEMALAALSDRYDGWFSSASEQAKIAGGNTARVCRFDAARLTAPASRANLGGSTSSACLPAEGKARLSPPTLIGRRRISQLNSG
jgi:hypothetical protein